MLFAHPPNRSQINMIKQEPVSPQATMRNLSPAESDDSIIPSIQLQQSHKIRVWEIWISLIR